MGETNPKLLWLSQTKRKKKKSNASIAIATGEGSRNLEEMKAVKKAKLKSDIATLRKR